MLDKKTENVLQLLVDQAHDGYKVLEKEQLLSRLTPKLKVDAQTFGAILAFLKENDYIDVKYQDKEQICLCTTVKADSYLEGERNVQQKAKITNGQLGFICTMMFLAAFLGTLIANLISKLF